MSREVKRVPLDFDWPCGQVWDGYIRPHTFDEKPCPECNNGMSIRAQHLHNQWYGYAPFLPKHTGSTPLAPDHPVIRARAKAAIERSPDNFGTGENAIVREASRLAALFNSQWSHHLAQEDVDALVAAGRLIDFTHTWSRHDGWQKIDPPVTPTAAQVNLWSLQGFGHDSINCHAVIAARCEREGVPHTCGTCAGHGSLEAYEGQRADGEAWKATEPPTGEGWQLWETVTAGSPISPVFADAASLARWLTTPEGGAKAGPFRQALTTSAAREFVAAGWAPTMVADGGGLHDGTDYVGTQAVLAKIIDPDVDASEPAATDETHDATTDTADDTMTEANPPAGRPPRPPATTVRPNHKLKEVRECSAMIPPRT